MSCIYNLVGFEYVIFDLQTFIMILLFILIMFCWYFWMTTLSLILCSCEEVAFLGFKVEGLVSLLFVTLVKL